MPRATPKVVLSSSAKPKQQHQTRRFYWPEYHTTKWRKRRKAYLRQYPSCVKCAEKDIETPAVVVDHIIPIQDGCDPWDETNWQGLCVPCDASKRGKTKRNYKG